jgi:hypothetical protein
MPSLAHTLAAALALLCLTPAAHAQPANRLGPVEPLYADFLDAGGAISLIESGAVASFEGLDRAAWQARFEASLSALNQTLARLDEARLSAQDRRALAGMRSGIEFRTNASLAPTGDCAAGARAGASGRELRTALYACFSSVGDAVAFEGRPYARVAALQLLERLDEPERRWALFMAMEPLWRAVNADNAPSSPYRRLIVAEAESARANIANAEQSLGLAPGAGERWLLQALEAWRDAAPLGEAIEPWDFRYGYAQGARVVHACAPRQRLADANNRFFADLGADLARLNVIQDLDARPGMAPVDYTDFVRIGRRVDGAWRPAVTHVSVLLQEGGLGGAGELAHEFGHAVHFSAIRARPSLVFTDDLSMPAEAFADITGWSVYDPAWQRKYLGCEASAADGLRARLGFSMLDIAWGLFELRMARTPESDPNLVWTEITSAYLHVTPHPELSWWAVRGQLVDDPGYMITYALGAFVTADLRARIRARIGPFDSGNRHWYGFVSRHLFRQGGEQPPRLLLRQFLGRPVSPDALLADIAQASAVR